jgi:transketolase
MNKPLRDVFGDALVEAGKRDPRVFVLDADLSGATRSIYFGKQFPERFFNVGIAEANMVSIAAGLASCGKIPFACTFSFLITLRAADQVRSQICYPKFNVKIIGTNGGLSGYGDGATHQCLKDLAVMRAMPGMTVIVPGDAAEMRALILQAAAMEGPVFIRVPRVAAPNLHPSPDSLKIGKGVKLRDGRDLTIVAMGTMVAKAIKAAAELADAGISAEVVEIHTLKPLDQDILIQSIAKTGAAVTVEEHSRIGGLFSAISEVAAKYHPIPVDYVAVEDRFGESGQYEEILAACGLTVSNIIMKGKAVIQRKQRYCG